jgi:hypothetical protein
MRFLTLFAAAIIAATASNPAFAKDRGPTVDASILACGEITDDRAYLACIAQVEEECGSFRKTSRRECEAAVDTARAEFERDQARADLAAARRTTTGPVARSEELGVSASLSVQLPATRPAGLVLTVQNPLGSAWATCGTCELFRGLQNHGADRAWVFYVDGVLAPVVYGDHTRPIVVDLDGNGQLDAAELSGIPAASGPDTSQAYLVSPPGRKVEVLAVEFILDPTLGGVYAPSGWTKLEVQDTSAARSRPSECVVAH